MLISEYKNNKFKLIASTWNDEFELSYSSYSVSDIEDYLEYIIKTMKGLSTNPPNHIYINTINNRLVFKTKDERKIK